MIDIWMTSVQLTFSFLREGLVMDPALGPAHSSGSRKPYERLAID